MIVGPSGDGKSSSIVVAPNGTLDLNNYQGLSADETVIINMDGKDLPFPYHKLGWEEGKNLFTSTYDNLITADALCGNDKKQDGILDRINAGTKIKKVIIDTMNGGMNDKELLETKRMTFDKW